MTIPQAKHNLSSERAADWLKQGQPLTNAYIEGVLKIQISDSWKQAVVFENCVVEYFSGSVTQFDKPVSVVNCHFKKCQFVFTYFLGGLIIDNCRFDDYLDFQAGGHNKPGNPVILTNNNFEGFVNFFDCWYEGEVTICNNKFQQGTNLLGKPHRIPVTFDVAPIVKDNLGRLDWNHEGEQTE